MATATASAPTTAPDVRTPDTTAFTGMQRMARTMWAPWLLMGVMIVVISFILGAINAGSNVAPYFENGKEVREAATAGSAIVSDKVGAELMAAFIPGFKFLGMGFLFGGITFIIATILGTLRNAGYRVQLAAGVTPRFPNPPAEARLFPLLMMMGFMALVATFIIGIWLAAQAGGYWNHSIAAELNPAAAGSDLLAQLGAINAVKAWAEPLKFVGVATMLTGIGLALATIVKVLRGQGQTIANLVAAAEAHNH